MFVWLPNQSSFVFSGGSGRRDESRLKLIQSRMRGREDYLLNFSSIHKSLQTFFSDFIFAFLVYWLNIQHYASALFTSLVNNITFASSLSLSYCFPQIFIFFVCTYRVIIEFNKKNVFPTRPQMFFFTRLIAYDELNSFFFLIMSHNSLVVCLQN